jgi:heme/copper-type cytochrome/quinol oxidase subunit 1
MPVKKGIYNLLLWTAVAVFLSSLFLFPKSSVLDIHLYDTYFVISDRYILCFLAIATLIVWLVYLLTDRILFSRLLTIIHIIVTILTTVFFAITLYLGTNIFNLRHQRVPNNVDWLTFETFGEYNKTVAIIILILLFGQVLLIINIIAGIIKKMTGSSRT